MGTKKSNANGKTEKWIDLSVEFVPLPEEMTPEEAQEWLENKFGCLQYAAAAAAANAPDEDTRGAAECMLMDLGHVVEELATAIGEGCSVKVRAAYPPTDVEYPERIKMLMRVAGTRGLWNHSEASSITDALDDLAREACRRVESLVAAGGTA